MSAGDIISMLFSINKIVRVDVYHLRWIVFDIGANNRLFLLRVINSFIIRLTGKHAIRLKCLTITQNF